MSMLSSQIDELRRMADGQATYREAREVMLRAADTITELSGALSVASVDYRHLSEENAKLRELCKDMMAFVEDDDACERCGHDAECVEAADGELVLPYEGRCLMLDLFADRMRELGVETDV